MKIVTFVFYLLVGVALGIFLLSNLDQEVFIYFTPSFRTREMSLSQALFWAMLTGLLIAAAIAMVAQYRVRSRNRQLRKDVERLEAELRELRRLPLSAPISGESREEAPAESGPKAPTEP